MHAKRIRSSRSGAIGAGLLVLVLVSSGPLQAVEIFAGIKARIAGAPTAPMSRVSIRIDSYTTDEQARAFLQTVASGKDAVVSALKKLNIGSVSITGSQPTQIRAAHAYPKGTGRRIVIVYDRPVTADPGPPSPAASFSVIELDVDAKGQGSGQIIDAVVIRLDKDGFVEVEKELTPPQLLVEVQTEQ